MLFPTLAHVDRIWAMIATATANDELGVAAKVTTERGQGPTAGRLICVYTRDFADKEDVKRMLETLVEMDVIPKGKGISYKAGECLYGSC